MKTVLFTNLAIWIGSCTAISVAIWITHSAIPLWALIIPMFSTLEIKIKNTDDKKKD